MGPPQKRPCSNSVRTRFYFIKTEGETRYKYIVNVLWHVKRQEKRCSNTGNTAQFSRRLRCIVAVHWRHFEMEVKILSCKIKEIRMRRCFSNSIFLVFKNTVSIALIFFGFLINLQVIFVLNKGDEKLCLLPFMDLIRHVARSIINHEFSFSLLR